MELDVDEPIEWAGHLGGIEAWKEVDSPLWRYIHSIAIHAAQVLLAEETPGIADPVEVLTEATEWLTIEMRTEGEGKWGNFRRFLVEHEIDPDRAISVDSRVTFEPRPIERVGIVLFEGRWFRFTADIDSSLTNIDTVSTWERIDESEARILLGVKVEAAIRLAAREKGVTWQQH